MSSSGSDTGPATPLPPLSTWHDTCEQRPAAAGRGTSVQDRISLFETNRNMAGDTKNRNLATSKHFRRHWSSGNIVFVTDKKESSSDPDDKDHRFPRPHHHHHHIRTLSVGDSCREREEQEGGVLGVEETMTSGEMFGVPTPRQSRGSQELNHRLRMKAEELESMFAEHQRRINGNRAAPKHVVAEEAGPAEMDVESTRSGGMRGRLYERYMEKRDARRREKYWRSNRAQEEEQTRTMWESVERSRAELKAWYERRELTDEDRERLGKLNSPSRPSFIRKNDQKTASSVPAEGRGDDMQSSDGSPKSVNSKLRTSRSVSSSASRISGSVVPRASKVPASGSLRADFRKENTKPSAGPSGVVRSKSTSAGINCFKEEKPPRSASLRKTSATPTPTPSRTAKEQSGSKPLILKKGGSGLSKLRTPISSELNGDFVNASARNLASMDVDASLDSPTSVSPSSLISQDGTARVRKKWGSAHVPFLVADGLHQPHTDSTKGLKRFLHFGKKSRGVESKVADLASVSAASGADCDMEVGRDLVSEQIRNLSVDYNRRVDSYDGFSFSEGMRRPEQAPRSFFSLSAFRNKGVESKLR